MEYFLFLRFFLFSWDMQVFLYMKYILSSRYYFWVSFFSTQQQNKAHKFKNNYFGTFSILDTR